jgi:hypothetical protein
MSCVESDIMNLAPLKSAFDLARNNKLPVGATTALIGAVLILDFLAAQKQIKNNNKNSKD